MEAVRFELKRLARGYARAVGGVRAARWHLVVLVTAIVLAFVHRAVVALPLFEHLVDQWIPALAAALALYLLGPVLRVLAAWFVRPPEARFARDLDDRFAWQDATETALTLEQAERGRPVPDLLAAQTAGRLRDVHPHSLAKGAKPSRWLRRILAFLFAAVLLLPGVAGLWGNTGGPTPDDPVGGPRAMRADVWLQTFIENPLTVEPLPEAKKNRRGAEDAEAEKKKKKEEQRRSGGGGK